jgi:hypothetical protein
MHIVLTDILTCASCGPTVGLILLADAIEERRVLTGVLGCPECMARYPVVGGVADLRSVSARGDLDASEALPSSSGAASTTPGGSVREGAIRLAALLGLAEGDGNVLILGDLSESVAALAEVVEDIEVVAVATKPGGGPARLGTTRIVAGDRLPFYSASVRAVAFLTGARIEWLDEALRVLSTAGRLVIEGASAEIAARVRELNLAILAEEDGTIVAIRR